MTEEAANSQCTRMFLLGTAQGEPWDTWPLLRDQVLSRVDHLMGHRKNIMSPFHYKPLHSMQWGVLADEYATVSALKAGGGGGRWERVSNPDHYYERTHFMRGAAFPRDWLPNDSRCSHCIVRKVDCLREPEFCFPPT